MASLRTAFMQTYSSSNSCLSFLHSLSSLLSLNYDDRPSQESPRHHQILTQSVSNSFKSIEKTLKIAKDRSMSLQFYSNPSLIRITDNESSDFSNMEDSSFVHALELISSNTSQTS